MCFYICYFYTLSMEKTLVIIPTYNEIENIEAIISAVFQSALQVDILVVDDQSPDGTGAMVKKLMKVYPENLFLEKIKVWVGRISDISHFNFTINV